MSYLGILNKYYCPSCNRELKINYDPESNVLAFDGCRDEDENEFIYWYDNTGKITKVDYFLFRDPYSFYITADLSGNSVVISCQNYEAETNEPFNAVYHGKYGIEDLNGLAERTFKLMVWK